jgi:hypothetical protein
MSSSVISATGLGFILCASLCCQRVVSQYEGQAAMERFTAHVVVLY